MMKKSDLISLIEKEGKFEEFEHAGLKCVVQRNRLGAWCGYVGVTPEYSLYGYGYDDLIEVSDEIRNREINIDKLGVMNFFAFCLRKQSGDIPEDDNRVPVSTVIEVHGGLTFSASSLADSRTWSDKDKKCLSDYSSDNDNVWWYGFDCGHAGDIVPHVYISEELKELRDKLITLFNSNDVYRTKEYVIEETQYLAEQLAKFKFKKDEQVRKDSERKTEMDKET